MIVPFGWIGEGAPLGTGTLLWALLLGATALWLRLSPAARSVRFVAGLAGVLAVPLLFAALPRLGASLEQGIFWVLAGVTLLSAGIAVSSRSPVYMAVWFALSLLATAGLFLLQGAEQKPWVGVTRRQLPEVQSAAVRQLAPILPSSTPGTGSHRGKTGSLPS